MPAHRFQPPLTVSRHALILLTALLGALTLREATAQPDHEHYEHEDHSRQTLAAEDLVRATRAGTTRFADVSAAEAAGYHVVTPFAFYGARAAHFQNDGYAADGRLLDPEHPEDLIYLKRDDGSMVLLGVMFLAPIGQGPDIGGSPAPWHTHDDLCGSTAGLVPSFPDGGCPSGTRHLRVEMLHIWLVDHPDGPFADGPPPSAVTVPLGSMAGGGSLAAGASLIDGQALAGAIGQALGLEPEWIAVRIVAGESLGEIADSQGVSRSELAGVIEERLTRDYEQAVAAGDMTPEQRDLLVSVLPLTVARLVDLHAGESWIIGGGAH